MRHRATLVGVCLTAGTLALWLYFRSQDGRSLSPLAADRLLQTAIREAERGQPDTAATLLRRILADHPEHDVVRKRLANIRLKQQRLPEVATLLAEVSDVSVDRSYEDWLALTKSLASRGCFIEAESILQRLTVAKPDHAAARRELLRCYRSSGRNAVAGNLLAVALSQPPIQLGDLLMVTATGRYWASDADLQLMRHVSRQHADPLIRLGLARREIESGNLASGVQLLQQILTDHPQWQPARTRLALTLWLLGRNDEWRQVLSDWDPAAIKDADGWFVWGVWHRQHQRSDVAIRCFCEALLCDSKHLAACSQLTTALRELGLESAASRMKHFSEHLSKCELHCIDVGHSLVPEGVQAIIAECDELGWAAEARAWNLYGQQKWKDREWPEKRETREPLIRHRAEINDTPLRQLVLDLEYQKYPLPTALERETATSRPESNDVAASASWSFEDEAESLGIRFQFANGLDPQRQRAFMFEFSGPGVGVFDYDRDGWPDLHLTQGATWPVQVGDTSSRDELFRNLGNGTFVPVPAAQLGEPGYSQGPAIGDFDNDGFPDVYICNIGPNRCYHNNGDGTFSEVTEFADVAGDEWSISAAWADLNDDGLSDLYVVNYLTGDVFERACLNGSGRPVQCPPTYFPAADDRLYLNGGDGTFREVSRAAELLVPDGKGMGVIVGRFLGSPQPGVFVTNDTTANYLFARTTVTEGTPHFVEQGTVAGVALGPNGNAQASMGIAAGDVNGDGRLDLFVTNFVRESSNLFLQGTEGMFEDGASRFGLTAAGYGTEGWGAQFLDVDADGHMDLFVANGHLEEQENQTGRMPPHLFRNRAGTRLELVSSPKTGRYFAGNYLGRSVVVWDWNRDGREDVCVSHATDPVAILTNRTESVGHRLSLRLVGVGAARDPIGARVTLTSNGLTQVRELVAGDGYAASCERRLTFGLGATTDPVEVRIDWPKGETQNFLKLAVDTDYVLIEGRPAPVRLRRYDLPSEQQVP